MRRGAKESHENAFLLTPTTPLPRRTWVSWRNEWVMSACGEWVVVSTRRGFYAGTLQLTYKRQRWTSFMIPWHPPTPFTPFIVGIFFPFFPHALCRIGGLNEVHINHRFNDFFIEVTMCYNGFPDASIRVTTTCQTSTPFPPIIVLDHLELHVAIAFLPRAWKFYRVILIYVRQCAYYGSKMANLGNRCERYASSIMIFGGTSYLKLCNAITCCSKFLFLWAKVE